MDKAEQLISCPNGDSKAQRMDILKQFESNPHAAYVLGLCCGRYGADIHLVAQILKHIESCRKELEFEADVLIVDALLLDGEVGKATATTNKLLKEKGLPLLPVGPQNSTILFPPKLAKKMDGKEVLPEKGERMLSHSTSDKSLTRSGSARVATGETAFGSHTTISKSNSKSFNSRGSPKDSLHKIKEKKEFGAVEIVNKVDENSIHKDTEIAPLHPLEKTYVCELCECSFPSELKYEKHVSYSTQHAIKVKEKEDEKLKALAPVILPVVPQKPKKTAELIFQGENHDWRLNIQLFHKIYEVLDDGVFVVKTTHLAGTHDDAYLNLNDLYVNKTAILQLVPADTFTPSNTIVGFADINHRGSKGSLKALTKGHSFTSSHSSVSTADEIDRINTVNNERVDLHIRRREYCKAIKNRFQIDAKENAIHLMRLASDPTDIVLEVKGYESEASNINFVESDGTFKIVGKNKNFGSRRSSLSEFMEMENSYKSSATELTAAVSETTKQLELMKNVVGSWTDSLIPKNQRSTFTSMPHARFQFAAFKAVQQKAVENTKELLRRLSNVDNDEAMVVENVSHSEIENLKEGEVSSASHSSNKKAFQKIV